MRQAVGKTSSGGTVPPQVLEARGADFAFRPLRFPPGERHTGPMGMRGGPAVLVRPA